MSVQGFKLYAEMKVVVSFFLYSKNIGSKNCFFEVSEGPEGF